MILAVHMLVGAAVSTRTKNLIKLFFYVVLSHFILDAIPHIEYGIDIFLKGSLFLNSKINAFYLIDALKICLDIFLALLIIFFITEKSRQKKFIRFGALVAALPDFLTFLSWKIKIKPLTLLAKFHHLVHPLYNNETLPWQGILTQTIVSFIAISYILYTVGRFRIIKFEQIRQSYANYRGQRY